RSAIWVSDWSSDVGSSDLDQVVCLTALADIHAWGVLDRTLIVVRSAWPADGQATQAPVLQGVAAVLRLYPELDPRQLVGSCARYTLTEVLSRVRMRRGAGSDGGGRGPAGAGVGEGGNHAPRGARRRPRGAGARRAAPGPGER